MNQIVSERNQITTNNKLFLADSKSLFTFKDKRRYIFGNHELRGNDLIVSVRNWISLVKGN